MKTLRHALEDSLALRRAMGCTLSEAGTLLPQCVECLAQRGHTCITTAAAVAWATQPQHGQPAAWASRLRCVRGCARSHHAIAPRTAIPPPALLPYRPQRRVPSLSSEAEIAQLLAAASRLPSALGLRASTSTTVFGLLVVTGMRISALVGLDNDDVDVAGGGRTIRNSKLRTSRWLPLPLTTQQALEGSVAQRHRVHPLLHTPSFFVSEQGTRLLAGTVRATFVQLTHQLGVRSPGDTQGPRLHDVRPRLAVQTLVRWYQEEVDVDRHRSALSTSLGHVKVSDTSWYVSATPALLGLATQRLEQTHRRLPS